VKNFAKTAAREEKEADGASGMWAEDRAASFCSREMPRGRLPLIDLPGKPICLRLSKGSSEALKFFRRQKAFAAILLELHDALRGRIETLIHNPVRTCEGIGTR
jgi:hypothetical protein